MKTKRFIKVLVLFLLVLSTEIFAQKDLIISGGNVVSSFVCENKKAYVWGMNSTSKGTGLLGLGAAYPAAIYNSPQPVPFPPGIEITQINSGSGAHFLALDCNANPWAWGMNSLGQIGNGAVGENYAYN